MHIYFILKIIYFLAIVFLFRISFFIFRFLSINSTPFSILLWLIFSFSKIIWKRTKPLTWNEDYDSHRSTLDMGIDDEAVSFFRSRHGTHQTALLHISWWWSAHAIPPGKMYAEFNSWYSVGQPWEGWEFVLTMKSFRKNERGRSKSPRAVTNFRFFKNMVLGSQRIWNLRTF